MAEVANKLNSNLLAGFSSVDGSGECEDFKRAEPDDELETLKLVISNPLFIESLENAVQEVADGNVESFDVDMLWREMNEDNRKS